MSLGDSVDDSVRPKPLLGIGSDPDWPDKVAGHIETVVVEIRKRSFEPLRTVATGVVLGVIIAAMIQVALVLLVIAASRFLNSYLFPGTVWAGYLIVGGIFSLAGMFLWSKRKPKSPEPR